MYIILLFYSLFIGLETLYIQTVQKLDRPKLRYLQ